MTKPEEALQHMVALKDHDYPEVAHIEADDILCEVLKGLGYHDLVDAFRDVDKWYN